MDNIEVLDKVHLVVIYHNQFLSVFGEYPAFLNILPRKEEGCYACSLRGREIMTTYRCKILPTLKE
jgi:hypothetical protein